MEDPVTAGDKIAFRMLSSFDLYFTILIGLASKQIPSCSSLGDQEKSFGYYGDNGIMFYFDETEKKCKDT